MWVENEETINSFCTPVFQAHAQTLSVITGSDLNIDFYQKQAGNDLYYSNRDFITDQNFISTERKVSFLFWRQWLST